MDTKILVLLLLGISLLAFGCAGKKANPPKEIVTEEIGPVINGTANDTEDDSDAEAEVQVDEDNETKDDVPDKVETNTSTGKDLSELADLFKVDTDKPLEDEGFDVKSPESNGS